MNIFEIQSKKFPYQPVKIFSDSKIKTFKSVIHTKDEAKGLKLPQKILIFGYLQVEIDPKDKKDITVGSPSHTDDEERY